MRGDTSDSDSVDSSSEDDSNIQLLRENSKLKAENQALLNKLASLKAALETREHELTRLTSTYEQRTLPCSCWQTVKSGRQPGTTATPNPVLSQHNRFQGLSPHNDVYCELDYRPKKLPASRTNDNPCKKATPPTPPSKITNGKPVNTGKKAPSPRAATAAKPGNGASSPPTGKAATPGNGDSSPRTGTAAKPRGKQPPNTKAPSSVKGKVLMLSDSQGRDCGPLLKDALGDNFTVESIFKPNGRLTDVVKDIDGLTMGFTQQDCVIIMAGSNDVDQQIRHELTIGLAMKKVIDVSKRTKVIINLIPSIHGKRPDGKSVTDANNFIKGMVQTEQLAENRNLILHSSLGFLHQANFNRFGIHINKRCKTDLCKEISEVVKLTCNPQLTPLEKWLKGRPIRSQTSPSTQTSSTAQSTKSIFGTKEASPKIVPAFEKTPTFISSSFLD